MSKRTPFDPDKQVYTAPVTWSGPCAPAALPQYAQPAFAVDEQHFMAMQSRTRAAKALADLADNCVLIAPMKLLPARERGFLFNAFWHCAGQPYAFVRDEHRWPDGLWHFVRRSYSPLIRHGFTLAELRAAGVVNWHECEHCPSGGTGRMLMLVDPQFNACDPQALMALAGVLQRVGDLIERTRARALEQA